MKTQPRWARSLSLGLAGFSAAGAVLMGAAPAAAESSRERNNRIATYALGAGTAYAAVKGKTGLALLGAAGTYYTYRQWKDAQNDRRQDQRWGRWDDRYRRDGRRTDRYDRNDRYERRSDLPRYDDYRYRRDRYDSRYDSRYERDRNDRRNDRWDDRWDDRYYGRR